MATKKQAKVTKKLLLVIHSWIKVSPITSVIIINGTSINIKAQHKMIKKRQITKLIKLVLKTEKWASLMFSSRYLLNQTTTFLEVGS